jgi:branched-chain amino acid transport system substrate-binding protein
MNQLARKREAITKMQAAVAAVIIIIAVIAGVAYYYSTMAPTPTPATPTPKTPTPATPTPATPTPATPTPATPTPATPTPATPTPATPTPATPTPPPKDKIVVGIVQSVSGPNSAGCALHHVYYDWIIEDYNAKGGLYVPEYGKRIRIEKIMYDDESNLDRMLSLTERLITVDKVDLIFAPWSTAFCFAAFSLYEKYHYPVVALTFGSDIAAEKMRTGEFKYAFSVLGLPGETGKEMADLLKYVDQYKSSINRVGIIYHSDQHGVEYAGAIFTYLTMAGFQVPVHQSYPPEISDFTPLISTLRNANVDVVILCGYAEGALLVHQCMAQNYNPKLIFIGPTMEVPGLVFGPFGFTPKDLIGVCYYDGWPATAYKEGELKEWAEMHKKRLGAYPFPASATFYAGLDCLFKAVEKVGLNREKIRDALATQTFDTLVGKTKLRPGYSMQAELAGTLTQWQGGEMMEVVWPLEAKSADIICPKPSWPS